MTGAGGKGQPHTGRRYVDDGLRREDLTEARINELIKDSDKSCPRLIARPTAAQFWRSMICPGIYGYSAMVR
jgi:hypothetical protein